MVSSLCGCLWGGLRKGTMLLPGLWNFIQEEVVPSAHPDARHFNFSPCATGALPAAVSMLKPRGSKSA